MKFRKNTTDVIGQYRRQYGNVNNQFNECIQNYQHIRQWCARRRHNWQPIGLIVFPVEFSSITLPFTSDLVSARFSLFINCSAFLSVSTIAFSWTIMVSFSLKLHVHIFAPITVCHLIKRAGYVLPNFNLLNTFGIIWLFSVGGSVTALSTATGCGLNSASQLHISPLVLLLLILGAGVFSMLTLIFWRWPEFIWHGSKENIHCQHYKE